MGEASGRRSEMLHRIRDFDVARTGISGSRPELTRRDRVTAFLIGLLGGFIVGLTSVGSGTFFGLTMLIVFSMGAHKVVGTDIFHAAALLYVAGFGHFVAGNVNMHIVGWLLLGSIPGVLIGSQWMVRLPEGMIRASLAVVLLLSGLKLVEFPGASVTIAVGLGVGALILTAFGLRDRARRRQRALLEQPPLAAERR